LGKLVYAFHSIFSFSMLQKCMQVLKNLL
jgi:hypothetical protein